MKKRYFIRRIFSARCIDYVNYFDSRRARGAVGRPVPASYVGDKKLARVWTSWKGANHAAKMLSIFWNLPHQVVHEGSPTLEDVCFGRHRQHYPRLDLIVKSILEKK